MLILFSMRVGSWKCLLTCKEKAPKSSYFDKEKFFYFITKNAANS